MSLCTQRLRRRKIRGKHRSKDLRLAVIPAVSSASLEFSRILFESCEYYEALTLRERILREPLGLNLTPEDLDGESQQYHFGVYDRNVNCLIACCVVDPRDQKRLKIRQMCVSSSYRGEGVGMFLMQQTELQCRDLGGTELMLHARVSVSDFYRKLGYTDFGAPFIEVSVPHILMKKYLPNIENSDAR